LSIWDIMITPLYVSHMYIFVF